MMIYVDQCLVRIVKKKVHVQAGGSEGFGKIQPWNLQWPVRVEDPDTEIASTRGNSHDHDANALDESANCLGIREDRLGKTPLTFAATRATSVALSRNPLGR